MKVRLLTHNDLDGSGCILACQHTFGVKNVDWTPHNYDDIDDAVTNVIINDPSITKRYDLIIISDISPDQPVVWEVDKLGATNIWQFDHHKTRAFQDRFSWVVFDMSRCGAKILFDWFLQEGYVYMDEETALFSEFIDAVNAYDLWIANDVKGKAWGDSLNRLHKALGQKAFISMGYNLIVDMEAKLRDSLVERETNIINTACNQAIEATDEDGKRFVATIASEHQSQVGHELLKRHAVARYAMVVSPVYGTCGLYSRSGEYDVSVLAQARHPKGGGHLNASGYSLPSGFVQKVINLLVK